MAGRLSKRLAVTDVLVPPPEPHTLVKVVGPVWICRAREQPGGRCTLLAKALQPVQQQDPADSAAPLVRPDTQLFHLTHGVVVTADGATPTMSCPFQAALQHAGSAVSRKSWKGHL